MPTVTVDLDLEGLANIVDDINLSTPTPPPLHGQGITAREISSSSTSLKHSSKGTPKRTCNNVLQYIGDSLTLVAKGVKDPKMRRVHWREELESAIMGMEGYDKDLLSDACDYLRKSKDAAWGFIARNTKCRQKWLDKFIENGGPMSSD